MTRSLISKERVIFYARTDCVYLFRRRYSCPSGSKEGVPGGGDAKVVPVDPGQPGSEV